MNPGKLDKKIQIWGNVKFKNELNAQDIEPRLLKSVWASVDFVSGAEKDGEADTRYEEQRCIVKMRSKAFPIKKEHWIVYKGVRLNIEVLPPDFDRGSIREIHCVVVDE